MREYDIEVFDEDGSSMTLTPVIPEDVVIIEVGPQGLPGNPGLIVLGPTAPVPPGTPAGTVILRTAT